MESTQAQTQAQTHTQTPQTGNGATAGATGASDSAAAAAGRTPRRKVASTSIANGVVTLDFGGSRQLTLDARKIPGATENINSPSPALDILAHGAARILQTACASSDDPHADAMSARDRILKGEWRPGRNATEKEPEPIIMALAEHLKKEPAWIISDYLPRYCEKRGHKRTDGKPSIAVAKRELMQHPDLAPIVGRILAERAKRLQNAAKGSKQTAPSLEL